MSEIKSYLQGGKLGDLIHSLVVCKFNYEFFNYKADLYIGNIGDNFEKGLEYTYNDLKPVLEQQEWLNSFGIYTDQHIDINLTKFRDSGYLYTTNWIEIYFGEFFNGMPAPKEYSWITLPKDENLQNTLLINRSMKPMTEKVTEFYKQVIDENKDLDKAFICFDENQYNNFTLRNECRMIKVNSLYDFFQKINSCKLFLGNQSGPMAWATSMNVPRIIELLARTDNVHYIKDTEYYSNFKWFQGDTA
jgi:hypothetical protein